MSEMSCIQCGFCCKQAPCQYGEWNTNTHQCNYLIGPSSIGQYSCGKYAEIVELEKDFKYPMGSGCSSTLFNKDRDELWAKIMQNT